MLSRFAAVRDGEGIDIYGVINAEIVHILGLFGGDSARFNTVKSTPLAGSFTRTTLPDIAAGKKPDGTGVGVYYVYDGPSVTQLLTTYDSSGGDTGTPTHTANPGAANFPVAFTSAFRGEVKLTGGIDPGNAAAGANTRFLASDNVALMLQDVYAYTIKLPSTLPNGTYAVAVANGALNVRGGPDGEPGGTAGGPASPSGPSGTGVNDTVRAADRDFGPASNDRITLRRDGSDLVITVEYGRDPVAGLDTEGDGDAPPFETRVPLASFTSINLDADGGDDEIVLDLSGGDFIPDGGFVLDGDAGTDRVRIVGGDGLRLAGDGRLTIPGAGTVNLRGVAQVDASGGESFATAENTPVVINPAGDADADPGSSPLTVGSFTQPANGTVTRNADGTLTYTPAPLFRGNDSFTVTLSDGSADGSGDLTTFRVSVRVDAPTLSGAITGPNGFADIVFGTASGTGIVSAYSGATRALLGSLTLAPTGGLFVAAGDLDGDGLADVVTGTASGPAQVTVFSSRLGTKQFTPAGGTGGVFVAVTDYNRDGKRELTVGGAPGAAPAVRAYSFPTLALLGSLTPFDPGFLGGVAVA